ncbi:MAG: SRPBCC family protein [Solirubrobacterales bacterium]|nr:SRPBCC family protein [Solirubrobacterales bacterium]
MSPEPTGVVERTPASRDLILIRELPLTGDELWSWVTESERLGRWFGTWSGPGRVGAEIEVTMTAEEGSPTSSGRIVACEPGRSYEVEVGDDHGEWHLILNVEEAGDGSKLVFTHRLGEEVETGPVGAGWEYYLDRLVAAVAGGEMPDFDEYWPAMGPYYAERG